MTAPPTTATADLSLVERLEAWAGDSCAEQFVRPFGGTDWESIGDAATKAADCIRTLEAEKRAAEERADDADREANTLAEALAAAEAETAALRAERDEARADRKALTVALTGLAGGGSEHFLRRGEDFIADADACVSRVRQRLEQRARLTKDAIMARDEAIRGERSRVASLTERVGELEAALRPFAEVETGHVADEASVEIGVDFTREEAEAFNSEIDERKLPIKKAGTDPYAVDAGLNWPKHILDLDGVSISAFRRARTVLTTTPAGTGDA